MVAERKPAGRPRSPASSEPTRGDSGGGGGDDSPGRGECALTRRGRWSTVALAIGGGVLFVVVGRLLFVDDPPDAARGPTWTWRDADGRVRPEPVEPLAGAGSSLPVSARAETVDPPLADRAADGDNAGDGDARAADRWRVVVQAVTEEVPPRALKEAAVTLGLQVGSELRVVASGIVDELGRFERDFAAAVNAVPALAREGLTVVATASAPGRFSRTGFASFEVGEPGVLLRLELARGAALRGRVAGINGRPVAEALVRALPVDGARGAPHTTTGRDGRFELEIREPDRWRLHAAAAGFGSVLTEEWSVEPEREVAIADLRLEAAGAIRGKTVDPRGEPVADVVVAAESVDLDWIEAIAASATPRKRGPTGRRSSDAGWPDLEPMGLDRCTTRSDRSGEFVLGGLRDLDFALTTPVEASIEPGDAVSHRIGDQGIVLVVTRHRARIVVRDEGDAPLPGIEMALRVDENRRSASTDAGGAVVVDAAPGQRLVASVSLRGCRQVSVEHTFGDAHEEVLLALTVAPLPVLRGALALTVVDAVGHPLTPVTVSLFAPGDMLVEEWYRRSLPPDGRMEGLPDGDYTFEVNAGRPRYAAFPDSGDCRTTMLPVKVVAGICRDVKVTLRVGGRLRIDLRLPAGVERSALADATLGRIEGDPSAAGHLDRSLGAGFMELPEGGVSFGGFDFTASGPWLSGALLDPGVHRLRFTAPGFRPIEQSFTIRAGEVADVELCLERNGG